MKQNRKQLCASLSFAVVLAFGLCVPAFADEAREVSLSGGTSAGTLASSSFNATFHDADFNQRVVSDSLLTTYLSASDAASNRSVSDALIATVGRASGVAGAPLSSDIRFEGGSDSDNNPPDLKGFRHGPRQSPRAPWCQSSPTPEPASMLLFGTGLLAIGAFVRRSRHSRSAQA